MLWPQRALTFGCRPRTRWQATMLWIVLLFPMNGRVFIGVVSAHLHGEWLWWLISWFARCCKKVLTTCGCASYGKLVLTITKIGSGGRSSGGGFNEHGFRMLSVKIVAGGRSSCKLVLTIMESGVFPCSTVVWVYGADTLFSIDGLILTFLTVLWGGAISPRMKHEFRFAQHG
jgi:hypothetical protein